jgi:hypothetical protein
LYLQAVSRTGETVDSGVLTAPNKAASARSRTVRKNPLAAGLQG